MATVQSPPTRVVVVPCTGERAEQEESGHRPLVHRHVTPRVAGLANGDAAPVRTPTQTRHLVACDGRAR